MLLANALDDCLKMVDAAKALDSRHAGVLALKAAILLKLNDNNGALREAHAALEIDPANAGALIILAAERLGRGDAQGALAILDRTRGSQEDFGIRLFKIKIYEKIGDFKQVEALLKKFVELYPNEKAFQRQLVELYIDQKRLHDAEKELRVIAAADPTNYEAGLDVVRFLNTFKGAAAARQDLISRISAGGGQAFHYQIALAASILRRAASPTAFSCSRSWQKARTATRH
jgi:tetratricopeptide (TPR) repeat protein